MKKRVLQDADKYVVRFPDGMRDRIAAEAKANNRSMNAEIIARLEQSFAMSSSGLTESTAEMLSAQIKELLKRVAPEE